MKRILILSTLLFSQMSFAQTVTELFNQGNWIKNREISIQSNSDVSKTSVSGTLSAQNKDYKESEMQKREQRLNEKRQRQQKYEYGQKKSQQNQQSPSYTKNHNQPMN